MTAFLPGLVKAQRQENLDGLVPDIFGNSGMHCNLKGGQNGPESLFCGKLFQI